MDKLMVQHFVLGKSHTAASLLQLDTWRVEGTGSSASTSLNVFDILFLIKHNHHVHQDYCFPRKKPAVND